MILCGPTGRISYLWSNFVSPSKPFSHEEDNILELQRNETGESEWQRLGIWKMNKKIVECPEFYSQP